MLWLQVQAFVHACRAALDGSWWQSHAAAAKAGIAAGLASLLGAQQGFRDDDSSPLPAAAVMILANTKLATTCLQARVPLLQPGAGMMAGARDVMMTKQHAGINLMKLLFDGAEIAHAGLLHVQQVDKYFLSSLSAHRT